MHNISEATLLINSDIVYKKMFRNKENTFIFHLPTIKEMYVSCYDFNVFRTLCTRPLKDLNKDFKQSFQSRKELFSFVLSLPDSNKIRQIMVYYLEICWRGFRLVDDFMICNNFRIMDNEVIDFFCNALSLGLGNITLEKFLDENDNEKLTPEEIEWKRREEEYKSKIASVKSSKEVNNVDINLMLLAINYDFRISLEELMDKNFYTILMYYNQVWKIDAYKTQLSYYGNSFAKPGKHKHWTQYKN